MNIASRALQFAGIVVVGIGLIYGVANNDMTSEIVFAALGLVLFVVGRAMRAS
ncbi:MAG TPA: hypothetical protein VNA88_15460 [Candidatus Kapabacteria bacterium]|jgi:hypothetical protein|nr:hypothetical protein [Candidatus Kapabacteria bacterium]